AQAGPGDASGVAARGEEVCARRRCFDALATLLAGTPGATLGVPGEAEIDPSARYLAAAASGCAATAGRFSLRNPRTCRSAIWICLGFAFHGYRVTWAFGARYTLSIATTYGWPGTSSGSTKTGV